MTLFSILISPLNAFPWVISGLMEAWVSTKRIQAFLELGELDLDQYCANMRGTVPLLLLPTATQLLPVIMTMQTMQWQW